MEFLNIGMFVIILVIVVSLFYACLSYYHVVQARGSFMSRSFLWGDFE